MKEELSELTGTPLEPGLPEGQWVVLTWSMTKYGKLEKQGIHGPYDSPTEAVKSAKRLVGEAREKATVHPMQASPELMVDVEKTND